MAYTRAKTTRRAKGTYRARGSVARRTSTRRAPARRSTRRASAGARTIRIVVEQGAANSVARPPLGMVQAQAPRKATF